MVENVSVFLFCFLVFTVNFTFFMTDNKPPCSVPTTSWYPLYRLRNKYSACVHRYADDTHISHIVGIFHSADRHTVNDRITKRMQTDLLLTFILHLSLLSLC